MVSNPSGVTFDHKSHAVELPNLGNLPILVSRRESPMFKASTSEQVRASARGLCNSTKFGSEEVL